MLYIRDDKLVNNDEIESMASKLDQYYKDFDLYEYRDYDCDDGNLFDEIKEMLFGGSLTSKPILDDLKINIEESDYMVTEGIILLRDLRNLVTRIDLAKN